MITPLSEIHSLIIYIIFGYTLLLPLLLISLRIFDITSPLQRSSLYLIAFLTPPAAFIIYHTVLVKRCQSGHIPIWSEHGFHLLCIISDSMLRVFLPLLGMLILFTLLKLAAARLLLKRLEAEATTLAPNKEKLVRTMIEKYSATLQIKPPRLIFSNRRDFAAFTTGIVKPVLVISKEMISHLNNSELIALLSHELIHIRHRDSLKSWALHLVRDLTFFNPLSTIIFKGYLREKEILCDQKAAELAGQSPQQYAALLLKVWRSLIEHRLPRLGVISSFTGKDNIESRVEALLNNTKEKRGFPTIATALLGLTIFTMTLLFLGFVC